MSKVLLVDTNFSSAPIYNYLIQSGLKVFVAGAKPTDFLAKSTQNYIEFDYSIIDQTREIIESMQIDYIVPGCNDHSYQVCAELNSDGKYHGIDTVEATATINNKELFRTFATQIGLPIPQVINSNDMNEKLPLIVKPVDAYSGRGISIIQEPEKHALKHAIDHAKDFSRSKRCIVEEYIAGQLYSHSAFITEGNIVADFIVEEHGTANPFVVDTSRVLYDFPLEMLDRVRDCIVLLAKKLNLVDGLIHTQFIKNGDSFWLIEVTRRCPGDLYSELIELSTGFNYAETYARPFVNQKLSFKRNKLKPSWVIRHTITQSTECVLGSIQFHIPVLIEKMIPISMAGEALKASPFGRAGLVFLKHNSKKAMAEVFQKTLNRSLYTIHKTN